MTREFRSLIFTTSAAVALLIATGLGPDARTQAAVHIETIAVSGDLAPGTGGATFRAFGNISYGNPAINEGGEVAFSGSLTGAGVDETNDAGIWVWHPDGDDPHFVAREGDPHPLVPEATFVYLFYPYLSDTGTVAFTTTSFDKDPERGGFQFGPDAVWLWDPGTEMFSPLALQGDPAPGTETGVTFFSFPHIGAPVNEEDFVGFRATVAGDGVTVSNDQGVWLWDGLRLDLVARERDPAPGIENFFYAKFAPDGRSPVGLNEHGEVSFLADVLTENGFSIRDDPFIPDEEIPPEDRSQGVWTGDLAPLPLVVQRDDLAPVLPGEEGDWIFCNFLPRLNRVGEVVFIAGMFKSVTCDIDRDNPPPGAQIIWAEKIMEDGSSEFVFIARQGDPAPGTDDGATFSGFWPTFMNGSGDVMIFTQFWVEECSSASTGYICEGIWVGNRDTGAIRLVARGGDPAPVPEAGASFTDFDRYALNDALNGSGRVAFRARLGGPCADSPSPVAIFAENSSGELILIVRGGDEIEVAPGDVRIVQAPNLVSGHGEDGTNASFNAAGQLALQIEFTDGSQGIFRASTAGATTGEVGTVTVKCSGKPGKGGGGGSGDKGGPPPGKGKK